MNSFLGAQLGSYQVQISTYEGPLDLLLNLIERAELDVTTVSLASVTDQYLAHLRELEQQKPEEISSFLVIAAKLVQIKSEALLPRPPQRPVDEEDPAISLVEQLKLYKRYKEIAAWMDARQRQNLRTHLRVAPPPKVEPKLDLSNLTLEKFLAAAEAAFAKEAEKKPLSSVITAPKVTIREKIDYITGALKSIQRMTFSGLITDKASRVEIVVTFLALLELVKRYRVTAKQETLFGDIEFERSDDWSSVEEIEIEFE